MYYLRLKFKNAILYNGGNKNYTKDIDGFITCRTSLSLGDSIHKNHISNVLHVLFGERPVPSLRECVYDKVPTLFDLADRCYLRIDNPMRYNKTLDKMEYICEIVQTKKSLSNSYNPDVKLNWFIIQQYFGYKYKDFMIFIEKISGIDNIRRKFYATDLEILLNPYKVDILNYVSQINKKAFYRALFGDPRTGDKKKTDISSMTASTIDPNALLTVNNGITTIINFYGEILVPLTDEQLELFRLVSTGSATLLDGGGVYVDEILSEHDLSEKTIETFKKVSEL